MNQKDTIRQLQIFQGNNRFFYVYKKTERLISAIYLITDLISDKEPIKWSLRNLGNRLLNESLSFVLKFQASVANYKGAETDAIEIQASFLETASLLEVSYISGQISKMNYEIIISELHSLLHLLDGYRSGEIMIKSDYNNVRKSISIPSDFFKTEDDALNIKDNIKDIINRASSEKSLLQNKGQNHNQILINKEQIKNVLDKSLPELKKIDRRELIVNVLKSSKDTGLTIKEISISHKNCSEKTIQRDLIDLINEGLVRKEGERRWSRYFLK